MCRAACRLEGMFMAAAITIDIDRKTAIQAGNGFSIARCAQVQSVLLTVPSPFWSSLLAWPAFGTVHQPQSCAAAGLTRCATDFALPSGLPSHTFQCGFSGWCSTTGDERRRNPEDICEGAEVAGPSVVRRRKFDSKNFKPLR